MRKNFAIRGFAEMLVGDAAIDLHNLYRTVSIGTDPGGGTMKVEFARDHGIEAQGEAPERVALTCSGNLRIAFYGLSGVPLRPGDDAIELGYFDDDCGWDEFLDEGLAAAQGFAGLHLMFPGGLVLRIRCDEAEAAID